MPTAAQDLLAHAYNEVDGLRTSRVQDVRRAPDGTVWIAARGGVSAFDGDRFVELFESVLRPAAEVRFVRFDAEGGAWLLFDESGILHADGESIVVMPRVGPPGTLRGVVDMEVLGAGDGARAVLSTASHGVIAREGDGWTTLVDASRLGGQQPLEPFDGGMLVGTADGLLQLAPNGALVGPFGEGLPAGPVRGLAPDGAALLVIGTDWLGRVQVDGAFELLAEGLPLGSGSAFGQLVQLANDGRGGAFYGNYSSLFHVDTRTGRARAIGRRNGLISGGVNSLALDDEGLVWAGSDLGVVKFLDLDLPVLRSAHGLLEDEATAIAPLADGRMVVGHHGGLTIVDGEATEIVRFDGLDSRLLGAGRVMDLAVDADGSVWVAATELGVARLVDGVLSEFTQIPAEWGGRAISVATSDRGLLVATSTHVLLFDGEGWRSDVPDLPAGVGVRRITLDDEGVLYLATTRGVWTLRGGELREHRTGNGASSATESFYSVLVARDGRVWCAGLDGLWLLERDRLVRPPVEPPVERASYSLVEDGAGRIWVGTDLGYTLIDGGEVTSLAWLARHTGFETNRAAAALDGAGRVWMGSVKGVSIFGPSFEPNATPPSVVQLEFRRDGSWSAVQPAVLGPNDPRLHLRVAARALRDERHVDIRYRVAGEAEWSVQSGSPVLVTDLGVLPTGRNRVEVQARGPGSGWSPSMFTPEIVVRGPVWTRWWFLALAGAAVVLVTIGVHRAVLDHRMARRLQAEVEARSRVLEASLSELAKSDRLRALGLLAGGIAHDLRNVLTVLTGTHSILRTHTSGVPQAEGLLDSTDVALDRAAQLATQLQTFATGGDPVRRAEAIDLLVKEAATLVLAGSRIELRLELDPDLWPAEVDADQMRQVLENVLVNARQCQTDGGWIRVTATNVELSTERAAAMEVVPGRHVRIEVGDGGPGIDRDARRRVFDPFFTTKAEGSGLGLATARSIVQRHGGAMEVDEDRGGGALLRIFLPASSGVPQVELRPARAPRSWHAGRALVVDDDDQVRELLGAMLCELGLEVSLAGTSAEASQAVEGGLVERRPLRVAVVDQTLPGDLSGTEILEQLRRLDPSIVAIATSGYSEEGVLADPHSYGFDAVLPKPFRLADIERALDAAFDAGSARGGGPPDRPVSPRHGSQPASRS